MKRSLFRFNLRLCERWVEKEIDEVKIPVFKIAGK
jgi:hypothetical protein